MAPPHSHRISRQGRNAHKRVDEEPHEDSQTGYGAVNEESEDDMSKLSQGTAVEKMIIGNLNDRKMHLAINKKKVKEDYGNVVVSLQDKITAFFDAHEDQSDTAHSAQLKRLADMIAAKATIESQMTTKVAHLRALYEAHSKELTSVVGARIKELK